MQRKDGIYELEYKGWDKHPIIDCLFMNKTNVVSIEISSKYY